MLIPINKKSIKKNPNYLSTTCTKFTGNATVNLRLTTKYDKVFLAQNQKNQRIRFIQFAPTEPLTMSLLYQYYGPLEIIKVNTTKVTNLLMKHKFTNFVKYPKFVVLDKLLEKFIITDILINNECSFNYEIDYDYNTIHHFPDTTKYLFEYSNISIQCPHCKNKFKSNDLVYDYIESDDYFHDFYKCPLCNEIIDNIEYQSIDDFKLL